MFRWTDAKFVFKRKLRSVLTDFLCTCAKFVIAFVSKVYSLLSNYHNSVCLFLKRVTFSELPAGKLCDDDEVYHMGYCYSFNGKPMKWNDAARYCNDQEKVMALTESDDDQTFYAGYIQGVLSAVPPQGPPVTGVWTSVRSVPNGSEPAWVSFPGSYVLKKQFWQVGEPNIYPNYDEVCASLQQESMFRNWMSESCDALNYVVCKRKAVDKGRLSFGTNIS
ncbi:lectin C-type domain protein [Cooperia oncophora]